MTALRCQFCKTIYRDGSTPYSDGICPTCQAELDAVSDDELAATWAELVERYEDRRKE